jgi:hypothetical protein
MRRERAVSPDARPRLDVGRVARAGLVLALLGVTLGPVLDYVHVVTGAIRYTPPVRFVPWWVPLLYTGAAVAIGLSHPIGDLLLRARPLPRRSGVELALGFAVFCGVWIASGALPFGSAVVAAILAPVSLALWAWLDRTWQGLAQAAVTALGGVAVEVALTRAGVFAHAHADVLGVALWLPWIYVAASVGVGNVGRWLVPAPR